MGRIFRNRTLQSVFWPRPRHARYPPGTRKVRAPTKTSPPRCEATTKVGYPCRGNATTNDPETGKRLCKTHAATEEERKIMMEQAQAVRRQAKLKPHELMRQVIESNPIAFMQPYLDALGIRVVMVPDPNDPNLLHPTAVMDPAANGATLYGVSKDGQVVISRHKDIEAQQRAAERLFDRVYGKPKQTNIIAGAATQSDPQLVPFDAGRQAEITAILEAATRPSHNLPASPPNSQN
jgi:hypothetical protein